MTASSFIVSDASSDGRRRSSSKAVRLAYSVLRAQADRDPASDAKAVAIASSIMLASARGGSR